MHCCWLHKVQHVTNQGWGPTGLKARTLTIFDLYQWYCWWTWEWDDCSLLASGKDPTETAEILNRDLNKISLWANCWKVIFNALKSKDLIFSNKCLNNSTPLLFNNNIIERVNTHRHLGVHLSSSLDWAVQINDVCLKATRKLSVLRIVKTQP